MMKIELTTDEVDAILVSLEYSKMNISNSADTPAEIRKKTLTQIDEIRGKLQAARKTAEI